MGDLNIGEKVPLYGDVVDSESPGRTSIKQRNK
jgi:hypothetical protein